MTRHCMTRRGAVPLVTVALLASACTSDLRMEVPQVGAAMPTFELESVEGETRSLSEFAGKVTLVNLWATWCPPCRAETPLLQAMHDSLGAQGFEVIGVTVDQAAARSAVDGFLSEYEVGYTQLLDPNMTTMDRFGVIGLPASYLIGRDGTVRAVRMGPIVEGDREFEAAVADALAEPVPSTGR